MTITEAMNKFKLPNPTTSEDLEMRFEKVLTFGDKVLLAGHFYNGPGNPCWFGAVYEFLDDEEEHDCESTIGLYAASGIEFDDAGHAIEWALKQ